MSTTPHDRSATDPDAAHATDHEYDGIHELDHPLPRWWLATFAITVVFALGYWIARQSLPNAQGSFEVYGEEQTEADRIANAKSVDPVALEAMAHDGSAVAAGKALFDNRCQACHGPQGQGQVGPNLTDRFWIHGGDVASIFTTISTGYPKAGMPKWRNVLEDQQMKELVAFLGSIRNSNVPGKPPQGDEYVGSAK